MSRLVALGLPIGFDVYFEEGEAPAPAMSGRCLCVGLEPGEEVEKTNIQDLGLLALSLDQDRLDDRFFTCLVCGQRWQETRTTMRRVERS